MIEHKSARVEVKVSEEGTIEAAFAQLNVVDHDGDVTLHGAFPTKDVAMSAFGHASWDGALPVGRGTITEEGDWAVFRGSLFMDTSHGRDAHGTLKGLRELAEFSYGYSVTDSAPGTFQGQSVRYLKALDPYEVSHVLKGAGLGTHLRSIKGGHPGPDAPYAEQLSWNVDSVAALLDRVKSRADLRAAEGRKLSRTDRARLEDLEAALTGHLDTVRELLVVPEDPKALAARMHLIHQLVGEAAGLGVTV